MVPILYIPPFDLARAYRQNHKIQSPDNHFLSQSPSEAGKCDVSDMEYK